MLEISVYDDMDTVINTYFEDPADNDREDTGTITQQDTTSSWENATSDEEDAVSTGEDAASKEEDQDLRKEVIDDPILCAIREYCVKNMQRFKLVKALYQGAQGKIPCIS